MMIIFIGSKRQLLRKVVSGITVLAVLVMLVMIGVSFLTQPRPVFNRMVEDKIPTGNPLRVDRENPSTFDRSIEQFVIKLQDFYYEERE